MRVGCFTLDLYCEHQDHVSKHGFQFQFTGETRAECMRQAKKLGWDLSNETAICPRHSGKKKNLPEKIP